MSTHVTPYKMALASLASNERYTEVVKHGGLRAGLYAPHESDEQKAHEENEFYVVLNGSGFFVVGDDREPFGPGDLLFVEAGTDHYFESFTPDFAVWAMFCPDTG